MTNPPMPPAGDLPVAPVPSWGSMEMASQHRKIDRYYNELAIGLDKLDERAELRWRRLRSLLCGIGLFLAVALALAELQLSHLGDIVLRVPLWMLAAGSVLLVHHGLGRPYPKPRVTDAENFADDRRRIEGN